MKIAMMKAVVSAVFTHTSFSTAGRRRRLAAASSIVPIAPTPEASVAVAMPKKIEPSTARISPAGGA